MDENYYKKLRVGDRGICAYCRKTADLLYWESFLGFCSHNCVYDWKKNSPNSSDRENGSSPSGADYSSGNSGSGRTKTTNPFHSIMGTISLEAPNMMDYFKEPSKEVQEQHERSIAEGVALRAQLRAQAETNADAYLTWPECYRGAFLPGVSNHGDCIFNESTDFLKPFQKEADRLGKSIKDVNWGEYIFFDGVLYEKAILYLSLRCMLARSLKKPLSAIPIPEDNEIKWVNLLSSTHTCLNFTENYCSRTGLTVNNEELGLRSYIYIKAQGVERYFGLHNKPSPPSINSDIFSTLLGPKDKEEQYKLGDKYYRKKNMRKAIFWYTKSALQGCTSAKSSLGIMLANGYGVSKDVANAIEWYFEAAIEYDDYARLNLGRRFKDGNGVPKDLEIAKFWLNEVNPYGDYSDERKKELQGLESY